MRALHRALRNILCLKEVTVRNKKKDIISYVYRCFLHLSKFFRVGCDAPPRAVKILCCGLPTFFFRCHNAERNNGYLQAVNGAHFFFPSSKSSSFCSPCVLVPRNTGVQTLARNRDNLGIWSMLLFLFSLCSCRDS